jgi:hypothetical protein
VLRIFPLFLLLLVANGCPQEEPPAEDESAALQPTERIPEQHRLLTYDSLRLGMSNFEVAQVYNAPEGKGDGFTRGVEEYGDVRNQVITFDKKDGWPDRKLVLRLYQDKLAKLVDRRDRLATKQVDEWRAQLIKTYGQPADETLPGAQWTWGEPGELTLIFTQDNQPDGQQSANVVLEHTPTYAASVRYLEWRVKHGVE